MNKVTWKCPHCGKDDRYDGQFSVAFGMRSYTYFPSSEGSMPTETERDPQTHECGGCKKSYIVRLETRVVALVAPIGEFTGGDV